MFDPMTTEAARIERNQAIACAQAFGAAMPMRPGLWARLVARARRTTPVAPVVQLPITMADPTASAVSAAA